MTAAATRTTPSSGSAAGVATRLDLATLGIVLTVALLGRALLLFLRALSLDGLVQGAGLAGRRRSCSGRRSRLTRLLSSLDGALTRSLFISLLARFACLLQAQLFSLNAGKLRRTACFAFASRALFGRQHVKDRTRRRRSGFRRRLGSRSGLNSSLNDGRCDRLRFGLWLGFRLRHGLRLGFGRHFDDRLGFGLGSHLHFGFGRHRGSFRDDLGKRRKIFLVVIERLFAFRLRTFGKQLRRITLDENALLAHLDLNRPCLASGIRSLDLGRLLARQRDLGFRSRFSMRATQIVQQARLVGFAHSIVFARLCNTGLLQLLKQDGCRHPQLAGELRHAHFCHIRNNLRLTRTSAHGPW
ncbi:hypothetical protein JY500_22035 (plasmid) [Niveibacterium microcysteis]|uniref:Uncharacterized protein n=1 Tax=Niveibacterium microcysteis TaxID=2811415 RepID=A0ABX7MES9_9RHOO|nr:hypothetical protein JY500_22035 [Niveibacterium microcysteis]